MIAQRPLIQVLKGASGPPAAPAPGLWLKAENYNGSTGTWTGAGTLGFSVSQASAPLRPAQVADSGFKSQPCVRFGGTSTLASNSAPLANSRARGTLMIAFRSDGNSWSDGAVFNTTQNQLSVIADGRVVLNGTTSEHGTLYDGSTIGAKSAMLSGSGGQLLTVVYDGTLTGNANRMKVWRNRVQVSLQFSGTIPATTYLGGSDLSFGIAWGHDSMEVLFWRDAALTGGERSAWEAYLAAKYFTKTTSNLVVTGDSNGIGSPNNLANPWPQRVADAFGWTLHNISSVGKEMNAENISPQYGYRDDWFVHQPYILALGTNDLGASNASLATLQGYVNSLIARMTACRYPIFVLTIPAVSTYPADTEVTRQAYNAWLTAGVAGATTIDIATPLGPSPGANFESDTVHFNNAGHAIAASTVAAAFHAAGY